MLVETGKFRDLLLGQDGAFGHDRQYLSGESGLIPSGSMKVRAMGLA
jgi:hypothetical protein